MQNESITPVPRVPGEAGTPPAGIPPGAIAGHIVPFPPRQPPPPAGVLDLAARLTADARDIRMGVDLVRAAATRAGKEGRSRVTRWDVLDVVAGCPAPPALTAGSGPAVCVSISG